jgi:uncharacterized RDD family membrane protein YckC
MEFEITYQLRANRGRRLANYFIDLAAQYIIVLGIGLTAGLLTYIDIYAPMEYVNSMGKLEEYLLGYIVMFIYYFTFESLTGGRTLGKYITGTKVLTWYGERPTAGRIAKRTLCRMIPLNHFSFLEENPRGWHDSISDTVVVEVKKYEQELNYRTAFSEIGTPPEDTANQ